MGGRGTDSATQGKKVASKSRAGAVIGTDALGGANRKKGFGKQGGSMDDYMDPAMKNAFNNQLPFGAVPKGTQRKKATKTKTSRGPRTQFDKRTQNQF